MKQITFSDVAYLVNKTTETKIDIENPLQQERDQFTLYKGKATSSTFSFEFEIIYIYSNATKECLTSIRSIIKKRNELKNIKSIYAPSTNKSIIDAITEQGIDCISLSDYFLSFINQQTELYKNKITEISFENYIDPKIESPTGFSRKTPNPVLSLITSPDQSEPTGKVAILLGEPGQGKTHMSKYLTTELIKHKKIPIYVHSEQWSDMKISDISSIWKTIISSFRYFDAPISWAEGSEKEFLKVALRLGAFRLIFDGFDEFVLWNKGAIDAREIIQELISLAEETGTIICLTSRSSFWRSEMLETEDEHYEVNKSNILEFTISPFDKNQAELYFKNRFSQRQDKQNQCIILFEKLQTKSSSSRLNFAGRGFFLSLIADLVNRSDNDNLETGDENSLHWIMNALCKREQMRQKLPIGADEQISILMDFSETTAKGEKNDTQTLKLAIQANTNLSDNEIEVLIKKPMKLKDHPLINFKKDTWNFTQDQIEYALLAKSIISNTQKKSQSNIINLINSPEFIKKFSNEVATSIVQQTFEYNNFKSACNACKTIIREILSAEGSKNSAERPTGSHLFAAQIAFITIEKEVIKEKVDRTKLLLDLLPNNQFSGLHITGSVRAFDFSDITISNCFFDNTKFINCKFSNKTIFKNCNFSEISIVNSEGFGSITWESTNRFDDLSKNIIELEAITAGSKKYNSENLDSDIAYLVQRFLPRETSGFKSVEERNLSKGLINHSIHKNEIITGFKTNLLQRHVSSGRTIYEVEPACRNDFSFYVSNGVFIGKLAELHNKLKAKLHI